MGVEFSSLEELKESKYLEDLIRKSLDVIYKSEKQYHDEKKIETDKTMQAHNVA
jgi:hypothetical protein